MFCKVFESNVSVNIHQIYVTADSGLKHGLKRSDDLLCIILGPSLQQKHWSFTLMFHWIQQIQWQKYLSLQ